MAGGVGGGAKGHNSLLLTMLLQTAAGEAAEERELERRETQVAPLDKAEWKAFAAEEGTRVECAESTARQADGTGHGSSARALQAIEDSMKKLAEEIKEIGAERRTQDGETHTARAHRQMLQWRRWLRFCDGDATHTAAHRAFTQANGGGVFGRAPSLDAEFAAAIANSPPGEPRRVALREECRKRYLAARARYHGTLEPAATDPDRVATKLAAELEQARQEGKCGQWEYFRAVGRAKAALAGKRTKPAGAAPGMTSIRRAGGGEAIRGTHAVLAAMQEDSSARHRERGASAAGTLTLIEEMHRAGVRMYREEATLDTRRPAERQAEWEADATIQRHARAAGEAWDEERRGRPTVGLEEALQTEAGRRMREATAAQMTRLVTRAAYDAGLQRFRERQGVGVGGFSGIWLARAGESTQARYLAALRGVATDLAVAAGELERAETEAAVTAAKAAIRQAAPRGWTEWLVILLAKPGKPRDVLGKLRDIYLQAHSLKLYMNCVGEHYKEAQRHVQPASNPGFRAAGSAQRAALVIGLQREEAVSERRAWHRGLCDKGGFFQSIPRRVQQAVEASSGVPAPITSSVLALHDTLRVRYDSGQGLTEGTDMQSGNGQGCSQGPPRSMTPLTVETRAVEWLVAGEQFRTPTGLPGARVGQTCFADDTAAGAGAHSTLQTSFTVTSGTSRVLGFEVGIDTDREGRPTGEKTGRQGAAPGTAGKYVAIDSGKDVVLVDGRVVPHAGKWYKHLGVRAEAASGWTAARRVVVARCTGMAGALARLGVLTADEYVECVDAATTTVVAYYGGIFPIGRSACNEIDVAKRRGLATLGHSGPRTARWLIHAPAPEGLGMALTWPHAAAALVVEVDRALRDSPQAPARVALAARMGREYWRLAWRPTPEAPTPAAWNPWHATDTLTEEGIVEAELLYRLEAGVETRAAAGDGVAEATSAGYEMPPAGDGAYQSLWEEPTATTRQFGRRLARLGVAQRRHLWTRDATTGTGRWRTPAELGRLMGRGGVTVGGERQGARLTAAEHTEYTTLLDGMTTAEDTWAAQHQGPEYVRPREPGITEVMAAGTGHDDSIEYLIQRSDGTTRWEARPRMPTGRERQQLDEALQRYDGMHEDFRGWLLHKKGGAWRWLATTAPMAAAADEAEATVAAAAAAGVESAAARMERAAAGAVVAGTGASATARGRAMAMAAEGAEREAEAATDAARAAEAAAVAAAACTAPMAVGKEPTEITDVRPLSGATAAALAAEVAEEAWAAAAAHRAVAAAEGVRGGGTRVGGAAPTATEAKAAQLVAETEAQWVTARARRYTGEMAALLVQWATERPEYAVARAQNADGAGARAAARRTPHRFRASADLTYFPGEQDEEEDDAGKRRMKPSLRVSEARGHAAREAAGATAMPDAERARRDPRLRDGAEAGGEDAGTGGGDRGTAAAREGEGDGSGGGRGAAREHSGGTPAQGAQGGDARQSPRQRQVEAMREAEERMDDDAAAAAAARGTGGSEDEWEAQAEWTEAVGARDADDEAAEAAMEATTYTAQAGQHAGEEAARRAATSLRACENKAAAWATRRAAAERAAHDAQREHEDGAEERARAVREAEARAQATRQEAQRLYVADVSDRPWQDFGAEVTVAEGALRQARDAARAYRAGPSERRARETEAQARGAAEAERSALAATARARTAAGGATAGTAAERAAAAGEAALERERATREREDGEREATRRREREEERARHAERAAAAATAERARAAAAAVMNDRTDAGRTGMGTDEGTEEAAYGQVEYWEDMPDGRRAEIARSPWLQLCTRRRSMEQACSWEETDRGVRISMEPGERRLISDANTEEVAAMGLAVENSYGAGYAYAVDGSKDEAEPRDDWESGTEAAAWGAWDGTQAMGGALPTGTSNQVAELVAVERVLARHKAGDKILIGGDCQSALGMIESAWRGGVIGAEACTDDKLGGLLVEAITRHRLRITAARATEHGGPGGEARDAYGWVRFIWIPAHSGGVSMNAYADAIAKSHLAEGPEDVPLHTMITRARIYAVASAAEDTSTPMARQRWMVAADRPLRQLMIERLTQREVARLRQDTRTGYAGCDAARHDRRIMLAVTGAAERTAGDGRSGATGGTRLTAVGRAMRLRANDLGMDKDGDAAECPLCGEGAAGGAHVMHCTAVSSERTRTRVAAAMRAAAEAAPERDRVVAPATTAAAAWAAAAREAGADGAAAWMIEASEGGAHTEHGGGMHAWAAKGWHHAHDVYHLQGTHSTDGEVMGMCMATLVAAGGVAMERMIAAATEAGGGHADATAAAAAQPICQAAAAAATGGTAAIVDARATIAQLEATTGRQGHGGTGAQLQEWDGEDAAWLRSVATGATRGGWQVHGRRTFARGAGAHKRKRDVTLAVAADGTVYHVRAPQQWPGRTTYTLRVDSGEEAAEERYTEVTMRTGRTEDGERMAVAVSARGVGAQGQRQRGRPAQRITVERDAAQLRAMFWVLGWPGQREGAGRMRAAIQRAVAATVDERDDAAWTALRLRMGGETPRASRSERASERQEKARLAQETATAETHAETARAAADEARGAAWRRLQGVTTGGHGEPPDGGGTQLRPGQIRTDAATLGVTTSATTTELRKAYLQRALHAHPDKGGSEAGFRAVSDAHERLAAIPAAQRETEARTEDAEAARAALTAATETAAAAASAEWERAAAAQAAAEVAERTAATTRAAQAAWVPRWTRVAEALKQATEAYFAGWRDYQRARRAHADREARREGYASQAARGAAGREAARARRDAERRRAVAEAVDATRQAERRTMERIAASRTEAETELRRVSAQQMARALEEHWDALREGYVVRTPWAMLCDTKCTCARRCRHRGSDAYEEYELAGMHWHRGARWVTLERRAARKPIQRPAMGTTWDSFDMAWATITGGRTYGTEQLRVQITERRGGHGSDSSASSDEGAEEMEAREARATARRAVRGQMERARAAAASADAEARTRAQEGTDTTQRGMEGGDAALAEEESGTCEAAAGEEEAAEAMRDATEGRDARETERAAGHSRAGQTTRRQRAWTGTWWWHGAWMGPVANAEYAVAWRGAQEAPDSARTARARHAARTRELATAVGGTHAAALGAAGRARRAGGTRWEEMTARIDATAMPAPHAAQGRGGAEERTAGGDARDTGEEAGDGAGHGSAATAAPSGAGTDRAGDREAAAATASRDGEGGAATAAAPARGPGGGGEQGTREGTAAAGATGEGAPEREGAAHAHEGGDERGEPGQEEVRGTVDIGKLDRATGRATTGAPRDTRDVAADRQHGGALGNAFVMPQLHRRPDDRYRTHVVEATRLMLEELDTRGWTSAEHIAWHGPGGTGWWVDGARVRLRVAPQWREEGQQAHTEGGDWHGRARWAAIEGLGEAVARGAHIRLLCHCRWTRRKEEGCEACHCEPTAAYIERAAARWHVALTRADALLKALETRRTGGGPEGGGARDPADGEGGGHHDAGGEGIQRGGGGHTSERGNQGQERAESEGDAARTGGKAARGATGGPSESDTPRQRDEATNKRKRRRAAGAQSHGQRRSATHQKGDDDW